MIKANLLRKKNAIIAFLLAFCFSLGMSAFTKTLVKAAEAGVDEEPTENIVLDMDGTQSWLEVGGEKVGNLNFDNALPGLISGATGATKMMWTGGGGLATVKLNKAYKAEYFEKVEIKLAVGAAGTASGYALSDTEHATAAGSVTTTVENENVVLSLDASVLANADGNIEGFILVTSGKANDFADYVQLVIPEKDPTEDVMLDMDGTNAVLGGVKVQLHKDNAIANDFFPGAKGETMMMFTDSGIGSNGVISVTFAKKYKAELFSTVTIRLLVGNGAADNTNVITLNGYALADTDCTVSAGSKEISGGGNVLSDLVMEAEKLADSDGYISGFLIKKTQTDEKQSGQFFADYVKLVLKVEEEKEPTENAVFDMDGVESWIEVDGVKVTNIHPDNVFHTLGNPNVFPKAEGKTKMMFTEDIGNQALIVVKLGKKVKAEYFEKIKINLCVGNNKNGAPAYSNAITVTGYAAADETFATPAGKIKTGGGEVTKLLSLNPETLKDADGYIESFVLRKTETDTECVGQIFVDYVEFCLVGSEPKPVVSEEFITKDISEVMPVESGVTFGVVTTEQTVNTTTVNAAVKAAAFDKLTLKITPDSESKFSTYILLKAPTASATYEDGGIFFWISNDSIVIGNKDVNENLLAAEFPANAFVSGKATEIAIAAIPYYINGENAGYYCALYLAGETNPLVEVYLGIEDVTAGVYTNILTQDLGNDYTVTYGSALSEPVKAKDLMNVKVVTRSGKDTFDTPRAALELTYFEVAGNVVGDLVIEGDATYESGFLTFQKAGTVKVKYTVTNAFGTFESNELTLTYVDGSSTADETENCSGCNGSAGSAGLIGLVILSIAAVTVVRRKK